MQLNAHSGISPTSYRMEDNAKHGLRHPTRFERNIFRSLIPPILVPVEMRQMGREGVLLSNLSIFYCEMLEPLLRLYFHVADPSRMLFLCRRSIFSFSRTRFIPLTAIGSSKGILFTSLFFLARYSVVLPASSLVTPYEVIMNSQRVSSLLRYQTVVSANVACC
uniref:Uncharacterized protein n=1 Tax=Parascaris univalens TaxID=6257 RepID=A0A915C042_PARUN